MFATREDTRNSQSMKLMEDFVQEVSIALKEKSHPVKAEHTKTREVRLSAGTALRDTIVRTTEQEINYLMIIMIQSMTNLEILLTTCLVSNLQSSVQMVSIARC
jgi:hypothetical protein